MMLCHAHPSPPVSSAYKRVCSQDNGYDCGVFLCVFMDYLSAGYVPASGDFTQADMPMFRQR